MIEIKWDQSVEKSSSAMSIVAAFLLWLTKTIENEENHDIVFTGYINIWDRNSKMSTLIFSDEVSNKRKLLDILLQPPGEFKNKYIPCVISEEPLCVSPIDDETLIVKKKDDDIT